MIWYADTPVYVYGAGLKGKLIFELLESLGCSVCGFLDQSPENVHTNRNVLHSDKLSAEQRKSSIVICSVTNVFEHRKIAFNLAQQGYGYILYKEINGNIDRNKEIIDTIWDAIEEVEQYSLAEIKNFIIGREIFSYQSIEEIEICGMNVSERNGYVNVVVPTILLYTFPKDLYLSFHKKQNWLRIPYERNVHYYLYCADLFRLFENGAASNQEWEEMIKVYKRYFANADVYTENNLEVKFRQHVMQRYSIYNEMNKLFHTNRRFFEDNPIFVKWNENRQCLYVRDGNNRLGFLLAKGMHNVVCRMAKKDYERWMREQEMQKFILSTVNEQAEVRMALRWMGRIDLLKTVNKALILSANSFLCNIFSKMGVEVTVGDKIESLEAFDLVWLNLSYVHSWTEKDNIIQLLDKYSKLVILEGVKENMKQLVSRIHGELQEPVCVYWNEDGKVELNLVRKGNYE